MSRPSFKNLKNNKINLGIIFSAALEREKDVYDLDWRLNIKPDLQSNCFVSVLTFYLTNIQSSTRIVNLGWSWN